jgi:putative membrane protein insertion efficiency factor
MSVLARAAVLGIRAYQVAISPILPQACRFAPSCSEYARQAFASHGFLGGSWLSARRLLRCHPFHPGGYDPPPEKLVGHRR